MTGQIVGTLAYVKVVAAGDQRGNIEVAFHDSGTNRFFFTPAAGETTSSLHLSTIGTILATALSNGQKVVLTYGDRIGKTGHDFYALDAQVMQAEFTWIKLKLKQPQTTGPDVWKDYEFLTKPKPVTAVMTDIP